MLEREATLTQLVELDPKFGDVEAQVTDGGVACRSRCPEVVTASRGVKWGLGNAVFGPLGCGLC